MRFDKDDRQKAEMCAGGVAASVNEFIGCEEALRRATKDESVGVGADIDSRLSVADVAFLSFLEEGGWRGPSRCYINLVSYPAHIR